MKNMILAIEAAPAAIPPNPNMAAITATTKNINDHLSMTKKFRLKIWLIYEFI